MKVCFALAIAVPILVNGAATSMRSTGTNFGPQNCVSLSRSSGGSCVIATDCEGNDLSKIEFAFDCFGHDGIVRHSFGTGGFESSEEFDTEVKCDRCESVSAADVVVKPAEQKVQAAAPQAQPVAKLALKPEVAKHVPAPVVFKAKRRHSAKVEVEAQAKTQTGFWPFTGSTPTIIPSTKKAPEVVRYGPDGCVSTWKSEEDHCIIKTDCDKSDISKYEFGLVCVDKVGSPVRHLFGKDSFDQAETFDTLIKCDKCLGLEDIPDGVALNGEVMTMSKDIANLQAVMKNISINVQMLNKEVFKGQQSAPAPSPAAAVEAPAPAKAALVHHSAEVSRTTNLRHSHRRHHERRDDDDYDDDDRDAGSDVQDAVLRDDEDEEDGDDED
jgi:hypothetical protein